MHHSKTNVKFKLAKLVASEDPTLRGAMYPQDVVTGVEGEFHTIVQRNERPIQGPNAQLLKSALWKVHVKSTAFYEPVTQAYTDDLGETLEAGMFLILTHKRHKTTKAWVELSKPVQYAVTFVHDGDGMGDLTLYLKSKDAS